MTAQTMFGLEDLLVEELKAIGAQQVVKQVRAASFVGDRACMYRANLWLRTAQRVLVPLGRFHVRREAELYDGVAAIRWEDHLGPDDTLAISCTLHSNQFTNAQFLSLKAKDAIVDRFRKRFGKRPSVDLDRPTLRIHLYIHEEDCIVSLDSSGAALHKRGYRDPTNLAPLSEVLAAGLVLLSGWDRTTAFVDPMCGSGTIPIEAAMIAGNIAPGIHRPHFGFQEWKDYDPSLWRSVREEARERATLGNRPVIVAGELSSNVARKASINIARAGLKGRIHVVNKPFQELEPPAAMGTMIMNPPYGERMDKEEDILTLYKTIGDTLKQRWSGWIAWLLTSNRAAANQVHLTPRPRIKLFNGSLECRFLRYELYSGTRRKFEVEAD